MKIGKQFKGIDNNGNSIIEDVSLPNTYTVFTLRTGQGHMKDFVREMQEHIGNEKDIKLILTKF